MAYTTQSELELAFGEAEVLALVDRDRDGVADAGVIERAIADADETINSYLRSRFDVPVADPPGLISKIARYLVRYQLSEDHAPDRVVNDNKQALAWLEQIRKGELDPGISTAGTAPEATGGGPTHHEGREAFPAHALDAWTGDA